MTLAVFYRPPEHRRFDTTFNYLSHAILDDPAFSPDPRSHPHYSLADARSFKALPPKSPSSESESESESLTSLSPFTSPALSSATSRSQSRSQSRGSPSPLSLSPPNSVSLSTHTKLISKPPPNPLPMPEILPKPDSTNTLARVNLKPVASQNTNIPRKAMMRALVRRLTSRHNLDRIDELDETDPFGGSYHHDGPYEAIGGNLPETSARGRREIHLRALRPGPHQSASRTPSAPSAGLSLNLEPGQILQQNTIYSAHASSIAPVPSQSRHQPNTIVTRPDHSRSSSLPNIRTRFPGDSSSLELLYGSQNQPSSCLHAPEERYFGDDTLDIPNSLPLHHDRDAAPCVPETTVFPPPRYESRFHSSGPPRLSQRTTRPSLNATSRKMQTADGTVPVLPPHSSRYQSVHSLDSSYKHNSTNPQSSSGVQNKPLEPPRIRHLPKRLVMPAPLQFQPPPPQHKFPSAEVATWQDGYPDDHTLEVDRFEGQPAMYSQELRLLRKKSSAFPAKAPIPDHAPMPQDDAVPITGISPAKMANEAEGTKERTRRRRLSKRKNDT